uniref:Uncharacterized protein n=1 Tax=Glossina pallidipes TaxID=7398 RepID=A0A1B0ACI7_GLOPL
MSTVNFNLGPVIDDRSLKLRCMCAIIRHPFWIASLCNTTQFQCPFLSSYHAFICASFELPLTPNIIANDYTEYRDYSLVDTHWVERWMKSNSMLLNISKSKVMRFGTMDLEDMKIQLGGSELECVDK